MTFFSITIFISFLVASSLALTTAWDKPRTKTSKSFSYFSGAIALWALGYFYWQISDSKDVSIFYARFLMSAAVFIPVTYLHFVIHLTETYDKFKTLLRSCYAIFILFFFLNFTPFFVSGARAVEGFKFWPEPGPFFHAFIVLWVAATVFSGYLLYKKYLTSIGIVHTQIGYVLFGMVAGIVGMAANYFLWYGIRVLPVGSILVSVYVGTLGYAVIRYRLMSISVFKRKILVYLLAGVLSYAGFYLLVIGHNLLFGGLFTTESYSVGLISVPAVVFLVFKGVIFSRKVIDAYFFPDILDFQNGIIDLSNRLAHAADIKNITESIAGTLSSVIGIKDIMVLTISENGKIIIEKTIGFSKEVGKDNADVINYLSRTNKIFVREEMSLSFLEKEPMAVQTMVMRLAATEISVCIPLVSNEKLIGAIFLGPKTSGDSYSNEDIDHLTAFSFEVAIAIENAKLYQKISGFNETLRKTVEEQTRDLQTANAHLLVLDKQKSDFVSIASHQIRTPITVIKIYSSMILDGSCGKITKKTTEATDKIFRSSKNLANIIEDFLNISRIEKGNILYNFTRVDIKEILSVLVEEFRFHADEKKQKINFLIDEGEYDAHADAGKIRQVLSNLIDNGIKYTPEKGSVDVCLSKDVENKKIIVSVKDNGIGMSKETLDILFQKFSRGEGVKKLNMEGTGLGLYVAREMVKAHGGKIWAESEGEGKGSTFFVELIQEV